MKAYPNSLYNLLKLIGVQWFWGLLFTRGKPILVFVPVKMFFDLIKAIKNLYSDVFILPVDFDPDISMSNIKNRLNMITRSAKAYFDLSDPPGDRP